MEIKIRYENRLTAIDVSEEELLPMVQLDYEKQLMEADDPASVRRRTPQEIIEERFNKPDYNNWHTHNRHWDRDALPPLNGKKRFLSNDLDDSDEIHHFDMDEFPDIAATEAWKRQEREEELKAMIRSELKPDYAEMLIAIDMDGMSVTDYAHRIGDKRINVSHRLQRAEKIFAKIFKKRPE